MAEMNGKPAALPLTLEENPAVNDIADTDGDSVASSQEDDDQKQPAATTDAPPRRRGSKGKELKQGQRSAIYYLLLNEINQDDDDLLSLNRGAQSKIARSMSISRNSVCRIWKTMERNRVNGTFPGPECVQSRSHLRNNKPKHSVPHIQEQVTRYVEANMNAAAMDDDNHNNNNDSSDTEANPWTAGTKAHAISLGTLSKALNIPKSTLGGYAKRRANPLRIPGINAPYPKPKARKKAQTSKKHAVAKKDTNK
jgi:hypothetical protein